ncbi:DUF309 domain-containing protein [Ammoniphilus sp. CFH 90114]|uniref:DUF309 domain-containing protein n=1 Tax=Ammoniphilus sp. CFH 90114 TaxID=2493665 RepID=UPI001F0BE425|nr:DUF309 domain-containing protein [Ammoniphilus sp. CFH 90114]
MHDRLYIEYLYYFNEERDYYECHEVMEELWLLEGKNKLLQGLLQVAVGLHHFRNDNITGAIKLFEQAMAKHQEPWSGELGINKERLFHEVQMYLYKLYDYNNKPFPFYDLTIEITDPSLAEAVSTCVPLGVAEEDKF